MKISTLTSKVISLSLVQGTLLIVNIVSGMIFSRVLTVQDYGTYLQTFLAYEFAASFLTFGIPTALYYLLTMESIEKKQVVINSIFILFIGGLFFSLFLYLGGAELLSDRFNNPVLSNTLRWMIFYPIYTFPLLICSSVWVSQNKTLLNASYNLVTGFIATISLIVSVLVSRDYVLPTLVKITLPLLFLPFAIFFIFKSLPGGWAIPGIDRMVKIISFSTPLGIASILGGLATQFSSLIVSSLTTPEQFAIYINGAKEVPFIGIITGSISLVVLTEMANEIKTNRIKEALDLFRKAATLSASFLFPMMVFLLVFSESFIEILYSRKYTESVFPFRIYLLMIPVRIIYYGSAFLAFGETKAILVRSLVDLAFIIFLTYLFVSFFGVNGAALGLLFTLYFWSVPFNLIFLRKLFDCDFSKLIPVKKLSKIILISSISVIIPYLFVFTNFSTPLKFAFSLITFLLIYTIISFKYNYEFKIQIYKLGSKYS